MRQIIEKTEETLNPHNIGPLGFRLPLDMLGEIGDAFTSGDEDSVTVLRLTIEGEPEATWLAFFPKGCTGAHCCGGMTEFHESHSIADLMADHGIVE